MRLVWPIRPDSPDMESDYGENRARNSFTFSPDGTCFMTGSCDKSPNQKWSRGEDRAHTQGIFICVMGRGNAVSNLEDDYGEERAENGETFGVTSGCILVRHVFHPFDKLEFRDFTSSL